MLESSCAFVVILTTCKVIQTYSVLIVTGTHLSGITVYDIVVDSSVVYAAVSGESAGESFCFCCYSYNL